MPRPTPVTYESSMKFYTALNLLPKNNRNFENIKLAKNWFYFIYLEFIVNDHRPIYWKYLIMSTICLLLFDIYYNMTAWKYIEI